MPKMIDAIMQKMRSRSKLSPESITIQIVKRSARPVWYTTPITIPAVAHATAMIRVIFAPFSSALTYALNGIQVFRRNKQQTGTAIVAQNAARPAERFKENKQTTSTTIGIRRCAPFLNTSPKFGNSSFRWPNKFSFEARISTIVKSET